MNRINFDRQANKDKFHRIPVTAEKFALSAGEGRSVKGYAAVWDVLSIERHGFFVRFAKGSMRLPKYPVTLQYNHNSDYLLATDENGTLGFAVDDVGVSMMGKLDDTFIDNYVLEKVKSGVIRHMSVGTYPIQTHLERYTITPDDVASNATLGEFVNHVVDVLVYDEWVLDELTITGLAQFPQTSVEAFKKKSADQICNSARLETYNRQIELIDLDV